MPGTASAAWHQSQIEHGELINGAWAVNVEQPGTFEISLYRWAPSLNKAMNMTAARLVIGGIDESLSLSADATSAVFRVPLSPGSTMLQTWLTRPDGRQHGAYFTRVRRVP
jgi:hypothetical protein